MNQETGPQRPESHVETPEKTSPEIPKLFEEPDLQEQYEAMVQKIDALKDRQVNTQKDIADFKAAVDKIFNREISLTAIGNTEEVRDTLKALAEAEVRDIQIRTIGKGLTEKMATITPPPETTWEEQSKRGP